MKYTKLGKSDLNVSRICMGCFWVAIVKKSFAISAKIHSICHDSISKKMKYLFLIDIFNRANVFAAFLTKM